MKIDNITIRVLGFFTMLTLWLVASEMRGCTEADLDHQAYWSGYHAAKKELGGTK